MKTILTTTIVFIGISAFAQVQSNTSPDKTKLQSKEVKSEERGLIYGAEMKHKKLSKLRSVKIESNEPPKETLETNNQ